MVNTTIDKKDSSIASAIHQGKSVADWEKLFKDSYGFTQQQLLAMVRDGQDLGRLLQGLDEADASQKDVNNPVFKDEEFFFNEDGKNEDGKTLDENAKKHIIHFVLFDQDGNEVKRKLIDPRDATLFNLEYLSACIEDLASVAKRFPHTPHEVGVLYVDGLPLSDISSVRKAQIRRLADSLDEASTADEEAALNEARQPEDVVTVEDFIEVLHRRTKLDDKIMFRGNKRELVLKDVVSKGQTALVDLVEGKASKILETEDGKETNEEECMKERRDWRNGGYGGTGRSYRSLGDKAPRGAEIGWFAVDKLDPNARGKMPGWRAGPSNFPFTDLLYPERKYKKGTFVMRNKYIKAGEMSGEKYVALASYFDALKNNDQEAINLLKALGIPLDLTFGMDPNDDYSVTYTLNEVDMGLNQPDYTKTVASMIQDLQHIADKWGDDLLVKIVNPVTLKETDPQLTINSKGSRTIVAIN